MDNLNKQLNETKKCIIQERKECFKYENMIKKQFKKIKEYEDLLQDYISYEVVLKELEAKHNQCKLIETNQDQLIKRLKTELEELRKKSNLIK